MKFETYIWIVKENDHENFNGRLNEILEFIENLEGFTEIKDIKFTVVNEFHIAHIIYLVKNEKERKKV